ncbi:NADP-dependent oxidoreductase [Streptomyces sp. NPDC048612]|uniref:NADP-dependent oxidoreductase n=1 Tax=Streptomyces sp. NPDC048612 TaxID=3365579 RepID=UPI003717D359
MSVLLTTGSLPPTTGREWHLVARPYGRPTPEDFALREAPVPELGEGQILVRNTYFSVDPYMRLRMNEVASYLPPFALGRPMDGGAVGEVIASRDGSRPVGGHVLHFTGWREYGVMDAKDATPVDPSLAPVSAYLGVLGTTGLSAYAGLLEVGALKEGDAVFVSGAAGAVGSVAGQIARIKGASRVVGSAGSDEKVRLLVEEYGFDAAFNYKNGEVARLLREAAPDGIDLYFDNVGGDHLEAALDSLNMYGRAVICGLISQYNATEPGPGPRNLEEMMFKRLRLLGMMTYDHSHLRPQFIEEVSGWLRSGELTYHETTVTGIENGVEAFLGMLRGDNTGKMLVSLGE